MTVEYQTLGERPITRAVTGSLPVGDQAAAGELARASPAPRDCWAVGLGLGELVAQLRDLVLELLVLAARLEGLVEPVDEVARRLQRPVGALLERAEDGGDDPLDAVHRAARPLVEVEAEQGQRGDDEQQQHRPPAAYLLSIHDRSKVAERLNAR